MVKKQQPKRQRDIKSKLMAAICMLLVSTIMMVSSTYAWFTLSTAPEVTGITTAVGANGNLEMALMPATGGVAAITSDTGDSLKDLVARNNTWGNLVSLSKDGTNLYGMEKITLFPAALNYTKEGTIDAATPLQTPSYGADGRVATLEKNGLTGTYNSTEQLFTPNTDKGVRAVGAASGMTPRQLDYRNAMSAANTAAAQAKTVASQSLNKNGAKLANIAIQHASDASAKYTQDDIAPLMNIVNDLLGSGTTTGALQYVETAYMQYILSYAASAKTGTEDTIWMAVKGAVSAEGATLDSVLTALGGNVPDGISDQINALKATKAAVTEAGTKLAALSGNEITWDQLSPALTLLANPNTMQVNSIPASEIKERMNELVNSVMSGGLTVTIASGGGVYADIADHCGNFSANVQIEKIEYGGMSVGPVTATMNTKTSQPTPYLNVVSAAVTEAKAPSSGTDTKMPISDFYGFILDLAFRTNAAESNLLLQIDAADRIYSDNTNEETMGHGSSMTFKATTTDLKDDQVKGLMDAIRIVFFDPDTGDIRVTAKLDAKNATLGADGWTAKMYLYKATAGGTTYELAAEGETATHIADASAEGGYRLATEGETATHVAKTTAAGEEALDNTIMPLTQNQAQALSVLVYLDGNNIGNDDVAATAATSMTGTMNLQFASSATLVPMEYAALHQGTGTTPEGGNDQQTPANLITLTNIARGDSDAATATAQYDPTAKTIIVEMGAGANTNGTVNVEVDGTSYPATYSAAGKWTTGAITGTVEAGTAITITYTAPSTDG